MVRFHYGDLADLAKDAKDAAKEAGAYADHLETKVKNKLSSYSGGMTSNINTAYSKVQLKINSLRAKSDALSAYSTKVSTFRNNVKTAESNLSNQIKTLIGNFRKKWGIKGKGFIESCIEAFCDFIGLGDLFNWMRSFLENIKAYIEHFINDLKDWYHFDGGAELIDAIIAAAVTVALIVIDAILIVVTGGTWLAILVSLAALLVAIANAYAKINMYIDGQKDKNILHRSANNKIASESDLASYLRRMGNYEAASAFQMIEVVVMVANIAKDATKFMKSFKTAIKNSGHLFKNVWKSIKEGGGKLFKKATDSKGFWKNAKKWVKIFNGRYSMLRTNNYGKNGGRAFWDTVKAGKDTWDTLINSTLENAWIFDYKDSDTGKKETTKMLDIYNSFLKDGMAVNNKIGSIRNHVNLNLDSFKYDAKIDKPSDRITKYLDTIGSPAKFMQWVASSIDPDYSVTNNLIVKPVTISQKTGAFDYYFLINGYNPILYVSSIL